ncbi:MAG: DUF4446 family protein [Ornithinimicrobium sp.]
MTSPEIASAAALVAVVLALIALGVAVAQRRRYAALARRYAVLWGEPNAETHRDIAQIMAGHVEALGTERTRIEALEQSVAVLRGGVEQSLQHVAVVRYDAFGDMGGRMSFSAAIIDDRGDGMVLSSIHARSESRTYAKGIVGGTSDVTLSPEERHALDAARSGTTS